MSKQLEVSEQTVHRWRQQYGGLKADDAKRSRLARLIASFATTTRNHPQGHSRVPTDTVSPMPSHVGHAIAPIPRQLNRCWAVSRPSDSTLSTASAARVTTASTSSSAVNGEST